VDLQSIDQVPHDRFERYIIYLLNKYPTANRDDIIEQSSQFIEDEVSNIYYMKMGWRDEINRYLNDKYPKENT
jgi:hypothetical protein